MRAMIHSISHQQTREGHNARRKRHHRSWLIVASAIVAVAIFAALGDFSSVPWLTLTGAVLQTTVRLVFAYLIALAVGVAIALLVGWSPFTDALFPVFDILQNVPSFALIPFFIYFLGYTDRMIVLFAVSSVLWPILFAVLAAIRNAHADLNDAATIFGARGVRRIPFYLMPLSLPAVLTGSIVGIAIGWESIIGAEIITNAAGFGSFIKDASATGVNQSAVAGMLVILLIVFTINRLVWAPLMTESAKRYAE